MPTFGGLLKKRRTKGSKGSSKDLTSSQTASSSQASSTLTTAQTHSTTSSDHPTTTTRQTTPSSPNHHTLSHPHSAPSAPAGASDAHKSGGHTHTASSAPADNSHTGNAEATTAPANAHTGPNRGHPMNASPHGPGAPGDARQVTSPGHHPHNQNVVSIRNIINSPHREDMASHMPADSQLASQQQQQQLTRTVPRQLKGKYALEDFALRRTLGTGSFGRVHLVQSTHNQRYYAMKVLKKEQVVKMKQIEHTNDERKMLARVRSPFLITLWGTFQDAKNLYMVMDFVEGGELFSLLRKSQRFPNPVAKFYAAEVVLALEYLHAQDVVYRDLKPENLLLDRHGHLKITDFGFAKECTDITWTLCGTPDYLAPEVVSSKGYNKSVDWWSLGVLVFEMLCGFTPFWDSGSPIKIYENILAGKVKYPPYMHPDAQNLLANLITADLTKRLGNLIGGCEDVKRHPWFAEVTWERLANREIDAPFVPPVKGGQGDASQFDSYPEETEQYGKGGKDLYGHHFVDF